MATNMCREGGALRRFIKAIEPWYDWGPRDILRIEVYERDFSDESEGVAWRFEIQWFGVHFAFEIGRTPPKVPAEEVAARKAARQEAR